MTNHDHHMVMKKVRIAELKARLSEHLREVRRGVTYAVMDRDTPVARLMPYSNEGEGLRIRPPRGRYPSFQKVPLPPPVRLKVDAVKLLIEERDKDR
jgi:antitoxin (DNA-binding transcriptional repressor) of toxin-antitoxin stability system